VSATSSPRKARIDLSFLNPQALSRRSWLMRVPLIGSLADVKTGWNPLWIEEFELITPHRPAAIVSLLNEQLPSGLALIDPTRRAAGYVWSDGFTVSRLTVGHNGFRAMGTGAMVWEGPATRIRLRVAVGKWTAYAMLLFYLVWAFGGLLAIVGSVVTLVEGRFIIWLPVIALGLLVGPLVIFALLAGRGARTLPRSRESEFILAFLRDAIGAESV
jgi:hypothetical protein